MIHPQTACPMMKINVTKTDGVITAEEDGPIDQFIRFPPILVKYALSNKLPNLNIEEYM